MYSQEWKTVHNKSKKSEDFTQDSRGKYNRLEYIPDFASDEEKVKFTTLKREIPHLMMPGHIRRIARKINIDLLAERVLSDEWVEYQRLGWAYNRVVKPDDMDQIPDDDSYDILPLDNKWGDAVLFRQIERKQKT